MKIIHAKIMRKIVKLINDNKIIASLLTRVPARLIKNFLSLFLCIAIDDLDVNELFFGFYQLDNIKSECVHITLKVRNVIKCYVRF